LVPFEPERAKKDVGDPKAKSKKSAKSKGKAEEETNAG
jgi:hypothetical protein